MCVQWGLWVSTSHLKSNFQWAQRKFTLSRLSMKTALQCTHTSFCTAGEKVLDRKGTWLSSLTFTSFTLPTQRADTCFDFECLLHNKVTKVGIETGRQMLFCHLSRGLCLSEVVGCVGTYQSQGQLPLFLFSPAKGESDWRALTLAFHRGSHIMFQ